MISKPHIVEDEFVVSLADVNRQPFCATRKGGTYCAGAVFSFCCFIDSATLAATFTLARQRILQHQLFVVR